jgi:phage-related protein
MAADAGWIVEDFETGAGGCPVRTFLRSLKGRDLAEAIALIKLAEERGSRLRAPHSKALGGGLFELRGRQVRIFYVFAPGRRIVLLSGIVKRQARIPLREMTGARLLQAEYAARETGGWTR